MDFILGQIEQKIKDLPEQGDKSIAINLHQIWFLYLMTLHLAVFYNSNREFVAQNKEEFLASLKNPALGTLLYLCNKLGGAYSFSESGDPLKKSLLRLLDEFVKTRNARIGHGMAISSDELEETLKTLQSIKSQILDAASNYTSKGVDNYIGNPCEITNDAGETYLNLKVNGEKKTVRISPFIHVDARTKDIYIFHTINKEILGEVCYYRISGNSAEDYTQCWEELALPHKIGKRDSYQEHPNAEFVPEIIVDAHGHGDVMSIGEALAIASDQTKIIVKPGNYHENLVINKQVFLCGEEGNVGAPVIWSDGNAPCIEIHATALLKNLRITNGLMEKPSKAIVVNSNATIENVEIFQWKGDGIFIKANTDPVIRKCKFNKCYGKNDKKQSPAIYGEKDACIHATGCEFNDSFSAVYIVEGESAIFEKCTVRNCKYAMTIIGTNTRISDCEFEKNYANPYFENCEVSIIQSKFLKPTCIGEVQGSNANLFIEDCVFSEFNGCAISLSDSNDCKIRKCQFLKLGTGITLDGSAHCTIKYCKFQDMERVGITANESSGFIEKCDFSKLNRGIDLYKSTDFTIKDCKIQDTEHVGITTYEASASIYDCEFSNNSSWAVFAENSKNLTLHKCKIHGKSSASKAVHLYDVSGDITYCEFIHLKESAMNIEGDSDVDIFECSFER